MGFITLYAEALARHSRTSRFLLTVMHTKRWPVHPDVPHIVGNFAQTVLLSLDVSNAHEQSFAAHLRATTLQLTEDNSTTQLSAARNFHKQSMRRASKHLKLCLRLHARLPLPSTLYQNLMVQQFRKWLLQPWRRTWHFQEPVDTAAFRFRTPGWTIKLWRTLVACCIILMCLRVNSHLALSEVLSQPTRVCCTNWQSRMKHGSSL